MNKHNWPQHFKDQYNEVIRKRRMLQVVKSAKERLIDERLCPSMWKMPINEQTVFSMLAYSFPFNHVILQILRKFFDLSGQTQLLVSSKYLYYSQNVFPGYYSDREKIVMILNRYRSSGDLQDFVKWLPFYADKSSGHLLHLMIGVFYLDQYLTNLKKINYLYISLDHLSKGQKDFENLESRLAFNGLIAFAHYMNQQFEISEDYLQKENEGEFQRKFLRLIKKAG